MEEQPLVQLLIIIIFSGEAKEFQCEIIITETDSKRSRPVEQRKQKSFDFFYFHLWFSSVNGQTLVSLPCAECVVQQQLHLKRVALPPPFLVLVLQFTVSSLPIQVRVLPRNTQYSPVCCYRFEVTVTLLVPLRKRSRRRIERKNWSNFTARFVERSSLAQQTITTGIGECSEFAHIRRPSPPELKEEKRDFSLSQRKVTITGQIHQCEGHGASEKHLVIMLIALVKRLTKGKCSTEGGKRNGKVNRLLFSLVSCNFSYNLSAKYLSK